MLGEANSAIASALALMENETGKIETVLFSEGLVHSSLYRSVKLTFPRDIGLKKPVIKNEMGQDSMGLAIGVLTPGMFVPVKQHL